MNLFIPILEGGAAFFCVGLMGLLFDAIRTVYVGLKVKK